MRGLGSGPNATIGQFSDLNIYAYAGDGNIKSKKVQLLVQDYEERGYRVYVQADRDGREADVIRGYRDDLGLSPSQFFSFSFDLETAIPLNYLYYGLSEMGFLEDVAFEGFKERMAENGVCVNDQLSSEFSLSLQGSDKVQLARTVGRALRKTHHLWWNNERFHSSELGRFLEFVQNARFCSDLEGYPADGENASGEIQNRQS